MIDQAARDALAEAIRPLLGGGPLAIPASYALANDLEEALDQQGFRVHAKRQQRNGRRPNASKRMTATLARNIRAYARRNPTETQAQIGAKYGVNPGRVSEVLARSRTWTGRTEEGEE